MDRGQPARPLQVHDQQEEHGEAGQALEQRGEQGCRHGRNPEDRQRQHGLSHSALDEDEHADQHQPADQEAGHGGVERRVGQPGHRPQHAEQAQPEGDHAGQVEAPPGTFGLVVQHPGGHGQRGHADRHVDPEDPPPGDIGDDHAAKHDADDGTHGPADRGVAVGLAPQLARVQVGDHRAAVGHDERPADALQDAEGDDRRLVPGQPAGQRAEHEDGEARLVHPDPAEHVAQSTDLGGQQRDDEQEADDDPDHRGQVHVQRALDLRQGQHDDRGIDRRHQHAGHDDGHRHADTRCGLDLFRRACHLGDGHAA